MKIDATKDELLTLLEELLSITEVVKDKGDHETRETWARISARTADLRDGEDV